LNRAARLAWPALGLGLALAAWWLGARALSDVAAVAEAFSPQAAARALGHLAGSGELWPHVGVSLRRIFVSLALALALGVPLGLALGLSRRFALACTPLFQLLRMISPLSWMPLAVMALGVGDAPVLFLLSFAALWPIVLNVAAGVSALDRHWLQLAQSLSATRTETVLQVVLPGVVAPALTGFRLSLGVAWIVLVPAEMLGVSAGLGYFILDTRDRLAYDELMAVIVVIGLLGYALDAAARWAGRQWAHEKAH
jgi:NitT/TauT family transport system permease protein